MLTKWSTIGIGAGVEMVLGIWFLYDWCWRLLFDYEHYANQQANAAKVAGIIGGWIGIIAGVVVWWVIGRSRHPARNHTRSQSRKQLPDERKPSKTTARKKIGNLPKLPMRKVD